MAKHELIDEIPNFYKVIPLSSFRSTPGVEFDILPPIHIPKIDGLDRVLHKSGAISPGPVGDVMTPWYMHPHQEDNLMVFYGTRYVDIYKKEAKRVFSFEVSTDKVIKDGKLIFEGPAMLVWSSYVFHRIRSAKDGSASLNLATRTAGFDINTNFNIYDLNTETGEFKVIREGHLDQSEYA